MRKYYVYMYSNPETKEPIYVGYGQGERYLRHLNYAKKNIQDVNRLKYYTIKKILSKGLEPIITKVAINLTKDEACKLEKQLIKLHGRKILKEGTLTNIAPGGEGGTGTHFKGKTYEEIVGEEKAKHLKKLRRQNALKQHANGNLNAKGKNNPNFGGKITASEKVRKKISETRIKNGLAKGANNPRASRKLITTPDGITYLVIGQYRKFCKEFKMSRKDPSPYKVVTLEKDDAIDIEYILY